MSSSPFSMSASLKVCILNDVILTVYTIQICKYKVVGHHDPLQNQEGMFSFKELSCWYWENVALYGSAGISANGRGLIDA